MLNHRGIRSQMDRMHGMLVLEDGTTLYRILQVSYRQSSSSNPCSCTKVHPCFIIPAQYLAVVVVLLVVVVSLLHLSLRWPFALWQPGQEGEIPSRRIIDWDRVTLHHTVHRIARDESLLSYL
uniref:HDC17404 n=1 Tax=Drosophila melanogaster TaxID=7227 RepID=Q6IIP7_DROME|nr:TPA_inf: HDC17404 [Drosophila melanogaster]